MVEDFKDLEVYQRALKASMGIFELSEEWPKEEIYSLTDQIRRSSRSVCSNLGEAWYKRLCEKHFISKLSDANSEAAETIVWLDIAHRCGYISEERASNYERGYRQIIGGIIKMIDHSDRWCGPSEHIREDRESYDMPSIFDDDLDF